MGYITDKIKIQVNSDIVVGFINLKDNEKYMHRIYTEWRFQNYLNVSCSPSSWLYLHS